MDQAWYFTRSGQQQGPVQWADLQKLAATNQLAPNDEVWTAGFTEWKAASSVRDLFTPADAPAEPIRAPAPIASPEPAAPQRFAPVRVHSAPTAVATAFPGSPLIDYAAVGGGERLCFAGFFMRFLAAFIDGLIVIAICGVLGLGFMWFVGEETVRANAATVGNFLRAMVLAVGWIYFATMESSPGQSTFGKRLLGLRVTDMSGNRISFARASVRHFGKILSQLVFMIGYVMMKFTPNNQCLHDLISGCVVMQKQWT